MAGDWMKIELDLPEKPEVSYIAGITNLEPYTVVGMLIRVWGWFDKHTTDGNASGVTFALVDRLVGVTGFGEAMALAGWLEQQDKTLHMPKFDRHTSESAKKRALTAKRQSRFRNADSNAGVTQPALPREEKRRINTTPAAFDAAAHLQTIGVSDKVAADWLALRKAKKAKVTETAIAGIQREADKAGISLQAALEKCCQNGWQGFNAEWIASAQNGPKRVAL